MRLSHNGVSRARFGVLIVLAVAVALTAGCGKSEDKKVATQVAAKVNGDEISVHQINNVLSRANGVTAENAPQAKREILDKLIDQQLAVQQAEEKKLDHTPAVMQAIEAAKREILARAYLEQVATAQPKPTAAEAKQFYAEHPALFAQRRVYNLQQILVPGDAGLATEVEQWISQGKTMQDIAGALNARNIKFSADAGVRSAEQLPLEALPKFQALKDGQTTVISGPQGIFIARVVASQAQPVDEATALPRIQQFLANKRGSEAVVSDMKALREKAKIERVGEFAAAPAAAAPAAPAAATTPAPAAATAPTPAAANTAAAAATTPAAPPPATTPAAAKPGPGAPAPKAAPIDDKSIAKGVAGLK